jgi:hypothetical protein
MASHKTDWFPGRVTRTYRKNYSQSFEARPGWCECGCRLINGLCVGCNRSVAQMDNIRINKEGMIIEYKGGF